MSKHSATRAADPRRKVDAAVIEQPHIRRHRAATFQMYAFLAFIVFVALAVAARIVPYFRIDLAVSHAIQLFHGPILDRLMYAVSWVDFAPQGEIIGAVSILALFFGGLRWEAVAASFAAFGIGVGLLVKQMVHRSRPSGDLIKVFAPLNSPSFPSGHVLTATVFCGFFAFLVYTLVKPKGTRIVLVVGAIVFAILMGISRIYQGQHWFSDVMGGYLLGIFWLGLTVKFYRWGKPRFFVDQPMAPEAPAQNASSAKTNST
jgi:membrane-associated phospholipid phosphatase